MSALPEPHPHLVRHASQKAMMHALVGEVTRSIETAISEHGRALMAVSGGSTPKPLYEALSQVGLDWSKVVIVLVDERWVEPSAPGSNEGMIQRALLRNEAAAASFIGLKSPGKTPFEGLAEARRRLDRVSLPIDVTILGMGSDGHTASWFPRADGLTEALASAGEKVCALKARQTDVTGTWCQRISLTRTALAPSRKLLLLMAGEAKLQTWGQACGPGPVENMPVRALLRDPAVALAAHWAP